MLKSLKNYLRGTRAHRLVKAVRTKLVKENNPRYMFISLKPDRSPVGNVLLSTLTDPFVRKSGEAITNAHTNQWETVQMARTFLDLGYCVDVIRWNNDRFVPFKDYDILVDFRMNLQRIGRLVGKDCLKIMHIETAHWLFHMTAQHKRLMALQKRRNVTVPLAKTVDPNWGIEHADCATILGNEFTINTYRYAGKPIYRVPISTTNMYPWPADKDFDACRRRFLWFGSGGLVHKGLDLVLEAFARMPEYHLTVCGPIKGERVFEKAYWKELYETPNIHTVGWIDVGKGDFVNLANHSIALVFPSCSEAGGGGVLTCMHAGIIPVVSVESSVDIDEGTGVVLTDSSVKSIQEAVRNLSRRPAVQLGSLARGAWEFARKNHTRETFSQAYARTIREILQQHHRSVRQPSAANDQCALPLEDRSEPVSP